MYTPDVMAVDPLIANPSLGLNTSLNKLRPEPWLKTCHSGSTVFSDSKDYLGMEA